MHIRPFHHKSDRAHVFLCVLGYYVECHMRQVLAPLLFDEHDRQGTQRTRSSVWAPAQPSPRIAAKVASKHTEEGLPVHNFRTLLNLNTTNTA